MIEGSAASTTTIAHAGIPENGVWWILGREQKHVFDVTRSAGLVALPAKCHISTVLGAGRERS